MTSVRSFDRENDPDVLCMIGASAALHISEIPFTQPTGSVRVGRVNGLVTPSGRVTGLDVVVPSGYEAMDRSILRAVQDAQPFPPFPLELGRDSLTVKIDFVLPPPNK